MNTDTAEQLGRQAFAHGMGNFPFAHDEIVDEMAGAKPGEKTHLLHAFNRGWTAANLAGANATLTVQMFGRTEHTQHASTDDALAHVAKIAANQNCRIQRGADEGTFIPQVWAGDHRVDDPRITWTFGAYRIA